MMMYMKDLVSENHLLRKIDKPLDLKYLEFKEELLKYDLIISNMTLNTSDFIKFYNNKWEDNKFYVFKNKTKKINCFINYYGMYSLCIIKKEKYLFIFNIIQYYNKKIMKKFIIF